MSFVSILLMIPLFFAAPSVDVVLSSASEKAIDVNLSGVEESFEQCLEGGLEVRYRFEYQICKTRSAWFDGCAGSYQTVNRVLYDPISENYKVISDRLGDGKDAAHKSMRTLREAVKVARTDLNLPLSHIAQDEPESLKSSRAYLSIRGRVVCHGSYNRTLARIYNVITLGIAGDEGIQTPWIDYPIRDLQDSSAESKLDS